MRVFRVRLHTDFFRRSARDVAQADIVDLDKLEAQAVGKLVEILVGPACSRLRLGRQGERRDRDIVDAAADDQRLGNTCRNAVIIGADFRLHAQDCVILTGADENRAVSMTRSSCVWL